MTYSGEPRIPGIREYKRRTRESGRQTKGSEMGDATAIDNLTPEDLAEPLTEEQRKAIKDANEGFNWGDEPKKKPEPKEDPEEEEETEESEEGEEEDEEQEESEEESEEEEDEETEEERLNRVAKEEGLTVEQVKENEKAEKALLDKYEGKTDKVVKALRHQNSAYSKIQKENDELRAFKATVEKARLVQMEERIDEALDKQRDELVERYLNLNPKIKEKYDLGDMSEDVVWEKAKTQIKANLQKKRDEERDELHTQANKRRDELANSLDEVNKEYVPEVRKLLDEVTDSEVMEEGFTVENYLFWARGKKFTPEHVKEIIEAAEKRAKDEPKIKKKKSLGDGRSPKGKKPAIANVSPQTRKRALEMFSMRDDMTDEQKIAEYNKNHAKHDSW